MKEPVKLVYERTYEESDAISKKEVNAFFESLKEALRKRELEEKKKDPKKLKFFIQMKEETKRKLDLDTDYDRSLHKSLEKKRRGGSPNSYIENIPHSSSSSIIPKQTYVPSGLDRDS